MARKMKDSGIEWIGEIPEGWSIARGKHILTLLQRAVFPTDGVITCFRDGEVTLRSNRREDGFTVSLKEIGYQGIEPGDLVVHGMDGFAGSIGISDSRGKSSPVLVVLDSSQDKKYLMYYLRSMAYNNVFLALSTGIRVRSCDLKWNKLADLLYLVPPIVEQHKLVSFLDEKCSEIDAILFKTRSSIEEYKKLKQAVITQAVTKGVRGEREMKDSGVEWIGEIPKYWNIGKLKYYWISVESGVSVNAADRPIDNPAQYGVLKTSSVSKFIFNPHEHKQVNNDEYSRVTCPVTADCIIVSRMNTPDLVGACGYVEKTYPNLFLPDRLWQISFRNDISAKFIWYYLNNKMVRSYISSLSTGTSSTMQNISQGQFGNISVCLPDSNEQKEIIAYLDTKCAEIDGLIAKKEQLVKELESYKKSLIYEVVTGKREV